MGIFRFAEKLTTATYEFERMTWDEMDEIFWTEEDIGEFRNYAFMVDCELEEEDWSGPNVPPLPWNKEIDNKKIEKDGELCNNFFLRKSKKFPKMKRILIKNGKLSKYWDPKNTHKYVRKANRHTDYFLFSYPYPISVKNQFLIKFPGKNGENLDQKKSNFENNLVCTQISYLISNM